MVEGAVATKPVGGHAVSELFADLTSITKTIQNPREASSNYR